MTDNFGEAGEDNMTIEDWVGLIFYVFLMILAIYLFGWVVP